MDISKTEHQIMQIIWQCAPCTANQIVEQLNNQTEWHEKTVKTLIGRLVKKGAISFVREGREYIYSPIIAEKDYQKQESESLVQRLFKGRISPLVATFAQDKKLNQNDIDELKKIIDGWENDEQRENQEQTENNQQGNQK